MTTIVEAWSFGRSELADSPTADTDARLLLEYVLQTTHASLIAHGEQLLTPGQEASYRTLVGRASQHEPIPYLIGTTEFFGLEFDVNSSVLIPRPETELLVGTAITWARPRGTINIVDIGTGSGCIAITLAVKLPQATVQAVDISADALAVAQQNAARHASGRITFTQGNLLTPLSGSFDLIAANLPYVAADEWSAVDESVKRYEPHLALDGGIDGLDLIRDLLAQATTKLNPGGLILLEIGWQQGQATKQLAQSFFPTAEIEIKQDFADHDRLVIIRA